MNLLSDLFNNFYFASIIKLLLASVLAGIIGLERDSCNKPAGFRTHSLVGISAVLVVICGEYMSLKYDIDPSRIAAQLLSGIGFIGAGTIMRDGFHVKGLTTASSLLAVTCIGLCIGCGFYFAAIMATVITYILLSYSYLLTDKLDHFTNSKLIISLESFNNNVFEKIEDIFESHDIIIKKMDKTNSENNSDSECKTITLEIKYDHNLKINSILSKISSIDSVNSVEEV